MLLINIRLKKEKKTGIVFYLKNIVNKITKVRKQFIAQTFIAIGFTYNNKKTKQWSIHKKHFTSDFMVVKKAMLELEMRITKPFRFVLSQTKKKNKSLK